MREQAVIFSEEVASVLIEHGFELIEQTELSWQFVDSPQLWNIVNDILGNM